MLREAGKPLAIWEMAIGALRAKGVKFPDRHTMKVTRTRLRDTFAKLEARGIAQTVGMGNATRRPLVEGRWAPRQDTRQRPPVHPESGKSQDHDDMVDRAVAGK
jgi:hypothetical protein